MEDSALSATLEEFDIVANRTGPHNHSERHSLRRILLHPDYTHIVVDIAGTVVVDTSAVEDSIEDKIVAAVQGRTELPVVETQLLVRRR